MGRGITRLILGLVLVAGCAGTGTRPYVNLANLDPTLASGAPGISPRPVLRIGPATAFSPKETLLLYGPLFDYLSRRLGRPVEVVLPRSYTEAIDLVRSGGVHVGIVSSYAYVLGRKEFGMEALAAPVYDGRPAYHSYILVRTYSGLTRFSDLKGHTFAYTDPLSATGRLYPEALILGLREPVDRFFEHTIFTSSHDRSIKALDQGLVDGAAVDSVIFRQAVGRDPDLQRRLQVIAVSGPLPTPPFVVHPRLGSELKRELQAALLDLDKVPEGREILAALQVDRFVASDDTWYDSVRTLARQVGVRP